MAGRGTCILLHAIDDTLLLEGERSVSLGRLDRARMAADPEGTIHVAGLRDGGLWHVAVDAGRKPSAVRVADIVDPHPAAGPDLASTPEGIRIVAPGPTPRTMALYTAEPGAKPRVLTIHAPVHPLLRYDAGRRRMHLIFCPWNDYSAIYDTVYYLRPDDHGETWLPADGTKHELPLQPNSREHGLERPRPEHISIIGQPAGGHSNTLAHCLELDPDGHPHTLYAFNRPYHLAREPFMRCVHVWWDGRTWSVDNWDGTRWTLGELAPDQSWDVGGGWLDIIDARRIRALLLFKDRTADWLDLGTASSADGGRTWSPIRPITADAPTKAARPISRPPSRWPGTTRCMRGATGTAGDIGPSTRRSSDRPWSRMAAGACTASSPSPKIRRRGSTAATGTATMAAIAGRGRSLSRRASRSMPRWAPFTGPPIRSGGASASSPTTGRSSSSDSCRRERRRPDPRAGRAGRERAVISWCSQHSLGRGKRATGCALTAPPRGT